MHVQGKMLKRVKDYLNSLQLPPEDEKRWGEPAARSQLYECVVHGRFESDLSSPLKACLQHLREALQPTHNFTGPLPRRINTPLEQLLPLHCFLTKHQRPGIRSVCVSVCVCVCVYVCVCARARMCVSIMHVINTCFLLQRFPTSEVNATLIWLRTHLIAF